MDNQTESRYAFEAWFKEEIIEAPDFVFKDFDADDGEYIVTEDDDDIDLYLNIQVMYMAWQASRAVEIELPNRLELEHGYGGGVLKKDPYGDYFERDEVIESIKSAGYRVKGE